MPSTLLPWRGFGLSEPFRKEMENLMERFFGEEASAPAPQAWSPRMDIEETARELVIKADIPGVDPSAVEISVENNVLTIRGEKKDTKEKTEKNYHRVERFVGSFYRAVALPSGLDTEKVTATSDHGVLTITVPKKPEVQPKKITVTAK